MKLNIGDAAEPVIDLKTKIAENLGDDFSVSRNLTVIHSLRMEEEK